MKKKTLIATCASVALIAAVGIGSTLAYFTDSDTEQNVLTFGHVDIELVEPEFSAEHTDNTIGPIVPNQEIVKDPTIIVAEDSEDAYLRASIVINDEEEVLTDDMKAQLEDNIAIAEGWVKSTDGYYYYQNIAEAEDSIPFFGSVKIPELWGNEVANLTFTIDVKAEAIQASSFAPTTDENQIIVAWKTTAGEEIKAETYDDEE